MAAATCVLDPSCSAEDVVEDMVTDSAAREDVDPCAEPHASVDPGSCQRARFLAQLDRVQHGVFEKNPTDIHLDASLSYGRTQHPHQQRPVGVGGDVSPPLPPHTLFLTHRASTRVAVHDASAKLPSGILNGNVNQFGDFHQCMSSGSPDGEVQGQHCVAYLQLLLRQEYPSSALQPHPVLAAIYDGVYSHHAFRSNFEDPGHRVPRFSTINWGVCVPAACSAQDVALQVEAWSRAVTEGTGIALRVRVDQDMCQVYRPWTSMPTSSILATAFFIGVLLLAGVATCYDNHLQKAAAAAEAEGKTDAKVSDRGLAADLFLAFSLRKNTTALLSTRRSSDDIESVHGIRFFNAMMLVLCHKSMSVFYNGYSNRTEMSEGIGQQWTVVARAASLYTDPFIMLSGLLTSYAYVKKLERGQKIHVVEELRNRLIRLVPSLAALILFCSFVLPWLGSGPMWNLVIKTHSDICKQHWWRNLLFIHNWFGFENMCLTHTHHVGIDTQLFLVSPIFVWLLWSRPKQGLVILGAVSAISTALRFYFTYHHQLSFFVYFGSSVSQMFRTADLSYIMPTHRLTVYLMGVVLGYALRHCGRDFKLKQSHLTLGWTLAAICLYLSVVTPSFMGKVGYRYEAIHAANYAAFAPITWCFLFGWIIFVSYIGKGGAIGRFFSWHGFLVCTRLSYALYLTQFPVFFYNVGLTNAPIQYSVFIMFNVKETIAIFIVSALLTILFEMPAQNIKNAISRYRKALPAGKTVGSIQEPQKLKVQ
ncbi:nose resistant to fluoxetine protein 6-like [Frankliniella occidentalis]|uniref:Nose resistant to fluoxetine protein 6-like n=1 Tax=Frankliniella occidentalis TaxID=133901 RepID=A0A9C6TPY9_FRAOC|nr:nose resistant to fluoxetine protein 6-like [Frankliniella occidentalis]